MGIYFFFLYFNSGSGDLGIWDLIFGDLGVIYLEYGIYFFWFLGFWDLRCWDLGFLDVGFRDLEDFLILDCKF